jgi:3-oxoacyl-[acyl-carrier protein] reductase
MAYRLNLESKVALVSGASRGIGAAIARSLAEQGCKLALTARNIDEVQSIADEIRKTHNVDCLVHVGDVVDSPSVQELYQNIFKKFDRLDILCANAGILGDGMLGMLRDDDIQRTLNTNVVGTLHHMQSAVHLMRRQKSGSVIVTSSIIGRVGNKGQTLYAASKAALIGMVLSAAKEVGADGIRVNAIAPGFIDTDMTKHLNDEVRKERLANIALGRAGTPNDVADVALFLASDLSRYVTGQVIGVDGGMVI